MPEYDVSCRLVENLTDSHGTEIVLRVMPRRGEHIMHNNNLYLVEEIAHWSRVRNSLSPDVSLKVKEVAKAQ